jgi:N-terminal region of glycosyl transferase group 7/N-terminal domain of galactosyltransferase/WW domain
MSAKDAPGSDEDHSLPLPSGWSRGYSKSQKRTYYFHAETKHTQWHFPTASEVADPIKAKKRADLNKAQEKRKSDDINISDKRVDKGSSSSAAISNTNKRMRVSNDILLTDTTSVAIIVPFRDLHAAQRRAAHLQTFLPQMHKFLSNLQSKRRISDYHIYIVEQSDDGRKFNRGKLLNIGFECARKNKQNLRAPHDVFIFHDVDLIPDDSLGSWYSQFPKVPIHIARVWNRYSNNPKYFGGVVSFSESDYKRINGYPNTFW